MSKVIISENTIQIPSDRIGIDMGQSLSKLAYLEKNELNLLLFPTQNSIPIIEDFINSKKGQINTFNFTGGRSFGLYKQFSEDLKSNLINEFEANVRGVEFLHKMEKNKELSRALIVTIGTGTSIVLKNDIFEHIGGSALGGGFFMGLIKTLFNLDDFNEILNLAKKGNRYNVDLKVSDIYHSDDKRVSLLFREYTAASLGKINEKFEKLYGRLDKINADIAALKVKSSVWGFLAGAVPVVAGLLIWLFKEMIKK